MQLICADWTGIGNFMKTFEKHGLHNIGIWKFQYGIFGI